MSEKEIVQKGKIKEYKYVPAPIDKGYNNRTLYVNVSDYNICEKSVSAQMKEK